MTIIRTSFSNLIVRSSFSLNHKMLGKILWPFKKTVLKLYEKCKILQFDTCMKYLLLYAKKQCSKLSWIFISYLPLDAKQQLNNQSMKLIQTENLPPWDATKTIVTNTKTPHLIIVSMLSCTCDILLRQ